MIEISRDEILQKNSRVRPSWPQNEWRNFGIVESRTISGGTTKKQIKSATCNKNEQQNSKNAELQTNWTKTTCKTFEETIRWGGNRSVKTYLRTSDDDDDDDDGDVMMMITEIYLEILRETKKRVPL